MIENMLITSTLLGQTQQHEPLSISMHHLIYAINKQQYIMTFTPFMDHNTQSLFVERLCLNRSFVRAVEPPTVAQMTCCDFLEMRQN